jgi:CRISPR/Cas system-associated exonuclease Cas4 (RecB family)
VSETLAHFDELWQRALEEENPFFRQGAPSPEQHSKLGHEILRGYLRSIEETRPPLAAELSFEIAVGGDKLRGVIDRIDEQEDGLIIVDFKSGARKLSQSEIARDLQLTVYAFAAQQLYGRPTARVAQYYLRDGTYLRSLRGPDDFAYLIADLLPHARRVLCEEQYPLRLGYWCNWCDFRELCKAERSCNSCQGSCGSSTPVGAIGQGRGEL